MNPARLPLANTLLTLPTPNTPDATQSVVGGDVGVPLRIYDLTPMGLKVVVAPYLDQAPGDTIWLHLNFHVFLVSEQTETATSKTTLYVPKKLLLAGIVNQLTYTVIRASENKGTSDPPLAMLYNAVRPGDVDTAPGTGGHSQLELILPDAIKNGVGPDFPVAGVQVCVSYPFCRAYDRIWLNCNGHAVFHTVTPDEAPPPPDAGSDIPTRVCFTVTRADLALGKDSQRFNLSYTVTDQVGNNPDPNNPWSASQLVDVDLAGHRLPLPLLREIPDDADDDPSTIDLDKLGSKDLLVVVLTVDNRFQKGDRIDVTYIAALPGQADVVVRVDEEVETDSFGQKTPCILRVPNDKVPANAVVRVSYQLLRGGVPIATSRTATAWVIGEGRPNPLPVPTFKEASGPQLDQINLEDVPQLGATVVIGASAGLKENDVVRVVVAGKTLVIESHTVLASEADKELAEIKVPYRFIADNADNSISMTYTVIRAAGGTDGPSNPSVYVIRRMVGPVPDFEGFDTAAVGELQIGRPLVLPTMIINRRSGKVSISDKKQSQNIQGNHIEFSLNAIFSIDLLRSVKIIRFTVAPYYANVKGVIVSYYDELELLEKISYGRPSFPTVTYSAPPGKKLTRMIVEDADQTTVFIDNFFFDLPYLASEE